jgi:hypothetical protein
MGRTSISHIEPPRFLTAIVPTTEIAGHRANRPLFCASIA